MIRSFADKMKVKQEAYAAEQEVLAEQAEHTRIQQEWQLMEEDRLAEIEKHKQLIAAKNAELFFRKQDEGMTFDKCFAEEASEKMRWDEGGATANT